MALERTAEDMSAAVLLLDDIEALEAWAHRMGFTDENRVDAHGDTTLDAELVDILESFRDDIRKLV